MVALDTLEAMAWVALALMGAAGKLDLVAEMADHVAVPWPRRLTVLAANNDVPTLGATQAKCARAEAIDRVVKDILDIVSSDDAAGKGLSGSGGG